MSKTVLVCCGTGCLANGSAKVAAEFHRLLEGSDHAVEWLVKETGCNGFCENGPLVKIDPDDITYYKVQVKDVPEIEEKTVLGGETVDRLLYKNDQGQRVRSQRENPFYAPQHKIALRNIGAISPTSVEDYVAHGGYQALRKALTMTPEEILDEMDRSGLRGRGGAGFPTGRKWRTAAGYDKFPKYVACNGDEGDPGAFMDRSILEGDPHSVLEGMAICALAIGAEEGFLYIRDEYALAVKNVRAAIAEAEAYGALGDHILGSDKKLKLSVVRGGGAFVCGESTALMASVEGRVGEPRAKYIRSVQRGLWDQPTVLNNVETLANVPVILLHGGDAFARMGTEGSKGTKVFALVGKVKRTGLVEVPMGVTLRHLIYDIGGGVQGDRPFKAVQTGGPSGGCIPAELLDLPVDFDTLKSRGAMMGSGGMIVMDDRSCMVEVARYYIKFLSEESCGKCTPCREGLRHMLQILTDICEGRGQLSDLDLLEELCHTLADSSLCALGKSAPNPVLTTLKYFRQEYEAHILEHRCPAGVCAALTSFAIDAEKCVGCGACGRACPAGAVSGERKQPHVIDPARCIACGSCREACKFGAVVTKGKVAG
ncbi:NADH-quinone oxidoreductase subunit F [Flavonifractor sp. An92]|uniref:NADH-ubiquinone oxidoreductase-F iron-sulfur binding region domain-containing protein n=1 Tax=Flavonifractor sp. An92 TaxID=1965666 RepID=UPI000B3AD102|nr:NADH-ubiquinone oxidoreductase-F iron-sulfur binding region domain-containing protein [Flavonifractor sp. An92]OUN05922.1 NADH-quinone oxidoreductase subunit F [Flavonifractor sp. An92]